MAEHDRRATIAEDYVAAIGARDEIVTFSLERDAPSFLGADTGQ